MGFMALCNASSFPFVSVSIASLKDAFYSASACDKEGELAEKVCNPDWIKEANQYILIFLGVILGLLIFQMIMRSLFGVMGEKLIAVLRRQMLQEMLYKQVSWYEAVHVCKRQAADQPFWYIMPGMRIYWVLNAGFTLGHDRYDHYDLRESR